MNAPEPVSFDELVWATTLRSVDFHEVAARRRTSDDPVHDGQPTTEFDVGATRNAELITVRCGVRIATPEAIFTVVAHAVFATVEPVEVDGEVMRQFVEQTGLSTLHPFLREAVRDLSSRIGVSPTLMAVLQPGQLQLGLTGTEHPPSPNRDAQA